jgi:peroxiredoxin
MRTHFWIVASLLVAAQPAGAAENSALRLEKGQELVWRGVFQEERLPPAVPMELSYDWEARLFVVDRDGAAARVALLTTMRLRPNPGAKASEVPQVAHIELLRVDERGRLVLMPPLSLIDPARRPEPRAVPPQPLDGLPILETGMFVEGPGGAMETGQSWDVAERGRPIRVWSMAGTETPHGTRCFKLTGVQQSPDWEVRRGGRAAWRRLDTVWLSAANGYAARVERLIERRNPETQEVCLRTQLTYELVGGTPRYPGQLYQDRIGEVTQALVCSALLDQFLRDGRAGTEAFDGLLRRIETHEAGRPTGETIPYREVLHAVRRRAIAARGGNIPPLPAAEEEAAAPTGGLILNQPAPDFLAPLISGTGGVRLERLRGKPVALFYYQPTADSAADVLRFAEALQGEVKGRATVLALAVGDEVVAKQQWQTLRLTVPVLAGGEARQLHGIEATPQVIVLDERGLVRCQLIGWGADTGEQVRRALRPSAETKRLGNKEPEASGRVKQRRNPRYRFPR